MTFFRSLLILSPAACLLAQTPPPKPAQAPPKPTVTLTTEDPNSKVMPTVPPDKVIVTVGDIKITAAQFDDIIKALAPQYQATARGAGREQFAKQLTRILVLAEEGKRRKLDETPAFKTQMMFQSANILAFNTSEALSKEGKLDDAAIRKYYDDHKSEFEEVHARHILVRMQGSPLPLKPGQKELTDAEALAKTEELRKKIVAGADFSNIALQESDDVTSGAKGGDLGFFRHNQMVPPFEEAAFKLQAGELSQPVKTPFGYHLIKVEERRSKTFEEAQPELERRLRPELTQKAIEALEKNASVSLDPVFFNLTPPNNPAPPKQ
jgi:peptidyl-prolyl cis-trans isomerase C